MSDPGLANVVAYSTSDGRWGYWPWNEARRSGDLKRLAAVNDRTLTLNAALAKLPDHKGVVKRGSSLSPRDQARYVPGEVVVEEAFTSASTERPFGGNTRFMIHSRHGKDIAPYSEHPNEKEVLFAAGTRFRVLDARRTGDNMTITLKELE